MELRLFFRAEYKGKSEELVFEASPQKECWSSLVSLLLNIKPEAKVPASNALDFRWTGTGPEIRSGKSLLVNGVSIHRRLLKPGDRIVIGAFRLFYEKTELFERPPEHAPAPKPAAVSKPVKKHKLKEKKVSVKKTELKAKAKLKPKQKLKVKAKPEEKPKPKPKLKQDSILKSKTTLKTKQKFKLKQKPKLKHKPESEPKPKLKFKLKLKPKTKAKLTKPAKPAKLIRKPSLKQKKNTFIPKIKYGCAAISGRLKAVFLDIRKTVSGIKFPSFSRKIFIRIGLVGAGAAVLAGIVVIGVFIYPGIPESGIDSDGETQTEVSMISQSEPKQTPRLKDNEREPGAAEEPEKLQVVVPGGEIPAMDLDILFIHAHPDDEALDYGCLLSLAQGAGLKTGLIVFTDGESGLDLYPDRPVTGDYPDHYMEGEELAAVRRMELEAAAGVLGIDLLVRLGRRNHPYNSKKDELSPEKILEIWGGEEYLSGLILDVIEKTDPEMIVAPDVPGKASEHFEHEAVGFLSAEIVNGMDPESPITPERFVTCIDPRQNHLYPDASVVKSDIRIKNGKPGPGKSTLREIQLASLAKHKTQNDAAVVGTGFLPEYDSEYYQIQFWRTEETWDEWIGALTRLPE